MKREILRMQRVTLLQDGATVLNNFSLQMFRGEIMGLLFLDTLGRRQLIDLLCENTPLHYGTVYMREKLVNSYSHHVGRAPNPVAVIDKRVRLVEDLTVADNIFVLRRGFKKYFIQPEVLYGQLAQFTREAGIGIRGDALVGELSVFEKCLVQLMKAVVTGTALVIVQDLSNILSAADLTRFHEVMRHYAAGGVAFLYICSHHEEAFALCDRAALVENGAVLRVMEKKAFSDELVWSYALDFSRIGPPGGAEEENAWALEFQNVHAGALAGLGFAIRPGECVVLLDVNNTSLGDMVEVLNGERQPACGRVLLDGAPLDAAARRRIAFVQENPARSMVYNGMSYLDNLCFLAGEKMPSLWRHRYLRESIAREYHALVGDEIYETDIRYLRTRSLYNLAYYRIHLANPRLAVCVQPFFGADMYLRHHILGLIDALRRRGIAVLLLSVNISDSLVVADRLLLVEHGRLAKAYDSRDFDQLQNERQAPRHGPLPPP